MKGIRKKKTLLPPVENAPLMAHLFGIKYHAIGNNTFFYILDNSETEKWELHAVKMN